MLRPARYTYKVIPMERSLAPPPSYKNRAMLPCMPDRSQRMLTEVRTQRN